MKLRTVARWPLPTISLVLALFAITGPALAAPPPELRLEGLQLSDHRGRVWTLQELLAGPNTVASGDELLVVAFLGTECPLAKLYATSLGALHDQYAPRGVRVVGVISNRQDSLQKIAAFVDRQRIAFPVLKDPRNRFADTVGAERTPEVFLFDAQRRLRYWGRVDDRYGIGYARDKAQREDLKLAIEDVLAGREVAVARTRSVGCIIGRTKPADSQATVTYLQPIAGILQKHCLECHREGEIAPFGMEDPEEVAGWADMIAEVVRQGRMPPWHASPAHGQFANDRSLSAEEKAAIETWAAAGAPLGDLAAQGHLLPEPPQFTSGWRLPRQPDRVIPVSSEPFDVPATGAVKYQYFKVDPGIEQDVWLEAAELQPGNRAVVHHILAFTRPRGSQGGINAARSFLVGYVPGASNDAWPAGMAKRIPGGSELIFQVHYTPNGTPQQDQSRLGLCFADPATITHEVHTSSALQPELAIPPGVSDYTTSALAPPLQSDGLLLAMSPHMHVRGKAFRYQLRRAGGPTTTLLDIPAYDFNWQTTYVLRQPLPLQRGDRIACTAVYDNSAANLNNPDPQRTVRWGDQTWDEMMIGYFHYATPRQPPAADDRSPQAGRLDRAATLRTFDALDADGDGRLSIAAIPAKLRRLAQSLDADGDGVLTRDEVLREAASGKP